MAGSANVHNVFVLGVVCVRHGLARPLHTAINLADANATIATMTRAPEEGKLSAAIKAARMVIKVFHPRRGHGQDGFSRLGLGAEGICLHRLDGGGAIATVQ